ncbi:MAG TPA: hypothetical protein VHU18_13600 [Rhizomicrobium sp.]|jgi:hypothetical protein|nr:hypothetical protein [Rhizomicrobium sp.]
MDRDFEPHRMATGPAQPATAPRPTGRYNFEVPEHLTISDMLAIQLADCVRIVQRLSDQASDPHLHDTERMHTIHSLSDVVNASEKLTRTIGRLRNESWEESDEMPRKKGRKV